MSIPKIYKIKLKTSNFPKMKQHKEIKIPKIISWLLFLPMRECLGKYWLKLSGKYPSVDLISFLNKFEFIELPASSWIISSFSALFLPLFNSSWASDILNLLGLSE